MRNIDSKNILSKNILSKNIEEQNAHDRNIDAIADADLGGYLTYRINISLDL